jgi:hypothetical protein
MRTRRRSAETFSLSFIDAISCGFGAVLLLLMLSKIFEPIRLEEGREDLRSLVARYEEELEDLLGETTEIQRERNTRVASVQAEKVRIGNLEAELLRLRASLEPENPDVSDEVARRLAQAKQSLTDEMRRLLANYRPPIENYKVGGIPVDSEYIIFLIDTSGSMRQYAWRRVQQQIRETLEIYPTVKGIQVMNDEGEYMFKSYRNEWIPDTPSRREAIIDGLKDWDAFSNSSPREGILAAIDTFWSPDKKISLYVYSDDFAQGSINAVVREIDRRNRAGASGERLVRIHAVAFPAIYQATGGELYSAAYFAVLMRAICQRNGGTFVALPLDRDL